jgi:hypothetical protein
MRRNKERGERNKEGWKETKDEDSLSLLGPSDHASKC